MLYDKRWERPEIKADPRSLAGLVSWLETKPENGTYDWHDCNGGCLIGIYGLAIGMGEEWHDFHYDLLKAGHLNIASDTPHTFGAALARAKSALASGMGELS